MQASMFDDRTCKLLTMFSGVLKQSTGVKDGETKNCHGIYTAHACSFCASSVMQSTPKRCKVPTAAVRGVSAGTAFRRIVLVPTWPFTFLRSSGSTRRRCVTFRRLSLAQRTYKYGAVTFCLTVQRDDYTMIDTYIC